MLDNGRFAPIGSRLKLARSLICYTKKMSFWNQLPRPFSVLAPMDDVTDVAFRQVVQQVAPPDVLFTEFVSTDGLNSAGRERTLERLRIEP